MNNTTEIKIEEIGGVSRIRELYKELKSITAISEQFIGEGVDIQEEVLRRFLYNRGISLPTENGFRRLGSSQRAFLKICGEQDPAEFLELWFNKIESVVETGLVFEEKYSTNITYHRLRSYLKEFKIHQFKNAVNKSKVQRIIYERGGWPLLKKIYHSCDKDLGKMIIYFEKEFDAVISYVSLARWLKVDVPVKPSKASKVIPLDRAMEFGIDINFRTVLIPVMVYTTKTNWELRDKYIYKSGKDSYVKWGNYLFIVKNKADANIIRVY